MEKLQNQIRDYANKVIDYVYEWNDENGHDENPTIQIKSIDSPIDDLYEVELVIRGADSLHKYITETKSKYVGRNTMPSFNKILEKLYGEVKDPLLYTTYIAASANIVNRDIIIKYNLNDYKQAARDQKLPKYMNVDEKDIKTIPIADKPSVLVKTTNRNVDYEIYLPNVGTIVAEIDNGYGSGQKYTHVVTSVTTKKIKTGKYAGNIVPTSAYMNLVIKIEDGVVYYEKMYSGKIKPYYQQGYSFWNENSSHNIKYFSFDEYTSPTIGYMK